MNILTFGNYIRKLRIEAGLGLREVARMLEISPSYLNDIEKNKRSAPKSTITSKIAKILNADKIIINDLASQSRKDIAADITEMIQNSSEIVNLLRAIQEFSPSEEQIKNMRD